MTCTKLIELLEFERGDLKDEIERDKWLESEKRGYDIGWTEAQKHFINNYLDAWCEGYKVAFCKHICDELNCERKR
jgi:hypothetical protein